MLETETRSLYLVDIPDFALSGDEPKNHRYSPENIDGCTSFERDNFAVMKMSCELLGLVWGQESEKYLDIANAIQAELMDFQFGFKDLGRFKKALERNDLLFKQKVIEIIVANTDETITIYPDNGHLYVKVEPNTKQLNQVKVTFTGIGGSFSAIFCKQAKSFIVGFKPWSRSSIRKQDVDDSQFEIDAIIRVIPGYPQKMTSLTKLLSEDESFTRAIELLNVSEESGNTLTLQLKEAFLRLDKQAEDSGLTKTFNIPTDKLWRAVLDTETESYPNIEISGEIGAVPVTCWCMIYN